MGSAAKGWVAVASSKAASVVAGARTPSTSARAVEAGMMTVMAMSSSATSTVEPVATIQMQMMTTARSPSSSMYSSLVLAQDCCPAATRFPAPVLPPDSAAAPAELGWRCRRRHRRSRHLRASPSPWPRCSIRNGSKSGTALAPADCKVGLVCWRSFSLFTYVAQFMPSNTVDSLLHPARRRRLRLHRPSACARQHQLRANAIPRRWLRAVMTRLPMCVRSLRTRGRFRPGFLPCPFLPAPWLRRSTEREANQRPPARVSLFHAEGKAQCAPSLHPCPARLPPGSERVWRSAPGACHCLQAAAVNHERGHRRRVVIHC